MKARNRRTSRRQSRTASSVGTDNSYGHPTEAALSRLRDADAQVFRTDLQGVIHAVSDGRSVTFETEVKDADSVRELIEKCAKNVLERENIPFDAEIDARVVDAEEIRRLNAEFRDKDAVTDVLSFPMFDYYNGAPREDLEPDPESGRVMLGDMVLCYTRACEQAEEYGHSAARECGFLTTHSVLHLLGYDHERGEDDTARMRRREKEYLEAIGLTRDDG